MSASCMLTCVPGYHAPHVLARVLHAHMRPGLSRTPRACPRPGPSRTPRAWPRPACSHASRAVTHPTCLAPACLGASCLLTHPTCPGSPCASCDLRHFARLSLDAPCGHPAGWAAQLAQRDSHRPRQRIVRHRNALNPPTSDKYFILWNKDGAFSRYLDK